MTYLLQNLLPNITYLSTKMYKTYLKARKTQSEDIESETDSNITHMLQLRNMRYKIAKMLMGNR